MGSYKTWTFLCETIEAEILYAHLYNMLYLFFVVW